MIIIPPSTLEEKNRDSNLLILLGKEGRIDGAFLKERMWLISADAENRMSQDVCEKRRFK